LDRALSRVTNKTRAQAPHGVWSLCSRLLILLGYVAAGIGAVCLLLGAALLAGAVAVAVVVRGLARPLALRVAARVSVPAAAADAAEPVPVKSAPRLAG
jgi:hypothetical protein